jgi:hypothetical protein
MSCTFDLSKSAPDDGDMFPAVTEFRYRNLQGTELFLQELNSQELLLDDGVSFADIHKISTDVKSRSDKGRELSIHVEGRQYFCIQSSFKRFVSLSPIFIMFDSNTRSGFP